MEQLFVTGAQGYSAEYSTSYLHGKTLPESKKWREPKGSRRIADSADFIFEGIELLN
jgi:hypothetical protein